ncbi:hypothetical protein SEA_JAAN_42 [Mycobacterium phage Jaan]|nr:hypothetical protein SEA_JAAN_42 [Mycobacterium phage Jaan]
MLGTKFAGLQEFTAEMVEAVGLHSVMLAAADSFHHMLRRHPEAVVAFDHTLRQDARYEPMTNRVMVRTQAYVIRAQLAIEGPK